MEIRVNKLIRGMGISCDDKYVSLLGNAINIPELSPNAKLIISVKSDAYEAIHVDNMYKLEMLELISLQKTIEMLIERKEAHIQLEGALQRLQFAGINEIKCNGYFVSKINGEFDHITDSKINFEEHSL